VPAPPGEECAGKLIQIQASGRGKKGELLKSGAHAPTGCTAVRATYECLVDLPLVQFANLKGEKGSSQRKKKPTTSGGPCRRERVKPTPYFGAVCAVTEDVRPRVARKRRKSKKTSSNKAVSASRVEITHSTDTGNGKRSPGTDKTPASKGGVRKRTASLKARKPGVWSKR